MGISRDSSENRLIVIIALMCGLNWIAFSANAVTLDELPQYHVDSHSKRLEDFNVYYLYDLSMRQAHEDVVQSGSWQPHSSRLVLPRTDGHHWFAFQLYNNNSTELHQVVRLDEVFPSVVEIYYPTQGQWQTERSGLSRPIAQRSFNSRLPGFVVDLRPFEHKTILLKVSSDYHLLTFGLVVEGLQSLLSNEKKYTAGYFFYFGAALSLVLYNFFIFISLRERLYGLYVMHGLSYLLFVLSYSGFDLYLHGGEWFHNKLDSMPAFALGFFSLFSRELLKTATNSFFFDKVLKLVALIFFGIGGLIFWDIGYGYLLVLFGIPATACLFLVGLISFYRGVRLSKYYVLGLSWYIGGAFLLASVNAGVLPYSWIGRYGFMIGSLIELSVLSYLLAYRIKLLQLEKFDYQQQLISTQQLASQRLEQQVQMRTLALQQANIQLEKQTQVDGLTGLFNRGYFDQVLAEEWRRQGRNQTSLCLLMCDIDHFKAFNDLYGHQSGDRCIQRVAQSMQFVCQRPADVCARYGGEEFVMILPDTDMQQGVLLANRIQQQLQHMHSDNEVPEAPVTLSFGVAAMVPNAETTAEELLLLADKALYKSKRAGRDCISSLQISPQQQQKTAGND